MKLTKYKVYLLQRAYKKTFIANTWFRRRSIEALASSEYLKRFGAISKGMHKGKQSYYLTEDGEKALNAYQSALTEKRRFRKQDALALAAIFATILVGLLQYFLGKG